MSEDEHTKQKRLQVAIRKASKARRCHTCSHLMDERDMGAVVPMCGRNMPPVPCGEERDA